MVLEAAKRNGMVGPPQVLDCTPLHDALAGAHFRLATFWLPILLGLLTMIWTQRDDDI